MACAPPALQRPPLRTWRFPARHHLPSKPQPPPAAPGSPPAAPPLPAPVPPPSAEAGGGSRFTPSTRLSAWPRPRPRWAAPAWLWARTPAPSRPPELQRRLFRAEAVLRVVSQDVNEASRGLLHCESLTLQSPCYVTYVSFRMEVNLSNTGKHNTELFF